MDLRQLRYFIAVFEQGSLSRAAADIPISQPALTRSLQLLEEELGTALLQRHARGVAPTTAGERFYAHAKSILAECARAQEDVLEAGDQLAGEVAVGVASLFAYTLMDTVVADFCARHPRVNLVVQQGLLDNLLAGLEQGDIELAFCNFPVQALPDTHEFETLLELNIYPYVHSSHPLAGRHNLGWADVAGEHWVNFSQPHSQEAFAALFINENAPPPETPVLTDSMALVKSMILRHGYVGVLPEEMMRAEVRSGDAVQLALPRTPLTRSAGLITRKTGYRRPLAELFADDIRAACRELAETST